MEISIAVKGWGKTADLVALGETWERELENGCVLRYGRSAAYAGIGDPAWQRRPPRIGGVVYRRADATPTTVSLPTGTRCAVVTANDVKELVVKAAEIVSEARELEREICTVKWGT